MSVEQWDEGRHAPMLAKWLEARGITKPLDWRTVPFTGYVVDDCYAGFIYLTNSSVAYMDSFVSDPKAPKTAREAASKELMEKLLEVARRYRVTRICGSTPSWHIAELVRKHDFTEVPGKFHYFIRSL